MAVSKVPFTVLAAPTLFDLSQCIHRTLCELDQLELLQTPLFQTPLLRHARLCGIIFHVEGPRQLRTSAVWAAEESRVIVYDSTGTRVREIKLSESPELKLPAKRAA